jgi:hypothetical protein
LLRYFEKFAGFKSDLQLADKELEESFTEYQKWHTCGANIGFIYAYSNEAFAGRYFLIDGQQRLTSVFLMLLTLAHRNSSLTARFRSTYLVDNDPKLDYKVREAARDFLFKLVPYLLDTAVANIDEQVWCYATDQSDTTNPAPAGQLPVAATLLFQPGVSSRAGPVPRQRRSLFRLPGELHLVLLLRYQHQRAGRGPLHERAGRADAKQREPEGRPAQRPRHRAGKKRIRHPVAGMAGLFLATPGPGHPQAPKP